MVFLFPVNFPSIFNITFCSSQFKHPVYGGHSQFVSHSKRVVWLSVTLSPLKDIYINCASLGALFAVPLGCFATVFKIHSNWRGSPKPNMKFHIVFIQCLQFLTFEAKCRIFIQLFFFFFFSYIWPSTSSLYPDKMGWCHHLFFTHV